MTKKDPWGERILMPVCLRPGMPEALKERAVEQATQTSRWVERTMLGKVHVDIAIVQEQWVGSDDENYWARFARGRQSVIDRCLRPFHTWVYWVDADIQAEPDLVLRLRDVSLSAGPPPLPIMSPLVLIEGTETNYDTAGMRQSYAYKSDPGAPWFEEDDDVMSMTGVYTLNSTGCVVLAPAAAHRIAKFSAQPEPGFGPHSLTEFWNFCQDAFEEGEHMTLVDTNLRAYHADLPKWGEAYH